MRVGVYDSVAVSHSGLSPGTRGVCSFPQSRRGAAFRLGQAPCRSGGRASGPAASRWSLQLRRNRREWLPLIRLLESWRSRGRRSNSRMPAAWATTCQLPTGDASGQRCAAEHARQPRRCPRGLDRIERFLKMTGFVRATPDFQRTPAVMDGASRTIWRTCSAPSCCPAAHCRRVSTLPSGASVEIDTIVKLRSSAEFGARLSRFHGRFPPQRRSGNGLRQQAGEREEDVERRSGDAVKSADLHNGAENRLELATGGLPRGPATWRSCVRRPSPRRRDAAQSRA